MVISIVACPIDSHSKRSSLKGSGQLQDGVARDPERVPDPTDAWYLAPRDGFVDGFTVQGEEIRELIDGEDRRQISRLASVAALIVRTRSSSLCPSGFVSHEGRTRASLAAVSGPIRGEGLPTKGFWTRLFAALVSNGVESADDVTPSKLRGISGFGPKRIAVPLRNRAAALGSELGRAQHELAIVHATAVTLGKAG